MLVILRLYCGYTSDSKYRNGGGGVNNVRFGQQTSLCIRNKALIANQSIISEIQRAYKVIVEKRKLNRIPNSQHRSFDTYQ